MPARQRICERSLGDKSMPEHWLNRLMPSVLGLLALLRLASQEIARRKPMRRSEVSQLLTVDTPIVGDMAAQTCLLFFPQFPGQSSYQIHSRSPTFFVASAWSKVEAM